MLVVEKEGRFTKTLRAIEELGKKKGKEPALSMIEQMIIDLSSLTDVTRHPFTNDR